MHLLEGKRVSTLLECIRSADVPYCQQESNYYSGNDHFLSFSQGFVFVFKWDSTRCKNSLKESKVQDALFKKKFNS